MTDAKGAQPEQLVETAMRLSKQATPGPWAIGFTGGQCHKDHRHGQGDCVYDAVEYPAEGGHSIYSKATLEDIAGNYDYEEGGIINERDLAFIAAARELVPALATALSECRERERLNDALIAAAEELRLWEPGRRGWAGAWRRYKEAMARYALAAQPPSEASEETP